MKVAAFSCLLSNAENSMSCLCLSPSWQAALSPYVCMWSACSNLSLKNKIFQFVERILEQVCSPEAKFWPSCGLQKILASAIQHSNATCFSFIPLFLLDYLKFQSIDWLSPLGLSWQYHCNIQICSNTCLLERKFFQSAQILCFFV